MLAVMTMFGTHVQASEPAEAKPQPLWEAGVFAVGGTQPAYPGSAQRTRSGIALPFFIYRGELVRAEQGGLNLRAARTPSWELDVGVAGSFGSAASGNDARRGMPNVGTLVEAGPRLKWNLGEWLGPGFGATLPLRAVFDINDGFGHRGFTLEPALTWGTRTGSGWGWGASAALLFGDQKLVDTFYGVAPAYAIATRPAYDARAGLIATRVGLNAFTRLSNDWRFFAYLRHDSVVGAANRASPLVETSGGMSAGVGLAWTWARSERAGMP